MVAVYSYRFAKRIIPGHNDGFAEFWTSCTEIDQLGATIICGWSWGVVVTVPVEISEVSFLEYLIYAVWAGEVIN